MIDNLSTSRGIVNAFVIGLALWAIIGVVIYGFT